MNILIAGGAGFIGSHLIDELLRKGNRVVCIDNLSLGTTRNICHLEDNEKFKFYENDLCNIDELEVVFEREKVDIVYHLAANSDIQASSKKPRIEYLNTFTSTYNILECMKKYNVKKLFFSSTSAVYGESLEGKLKEETGPLEPISYYGAAKLSSEAMISAFSHMNDLKVVVFRFPNVIGSRLTHGVVYDFVRKLKNNPLILEILGDGTQCKPYLHVSDLVRGIVQLTEDIDNGVKFFNIGVESKTDVTTIADIVVEEMNLKNVSYHYTGGNIGWKGDVPTFEYDLAKIRATGWKSTYTSDEAVRKTVKEVLE